MEVSPFTLWLRCENVLMAECLTMWRILAVQSLESFTISMVGKHGLGSGASSALENGYLRCSDVVISSCSK